MELEFERGDFLAEDAWYTEIFQSTSQDHLGLGYCSFIVDHESLTRTNLSQSLLNRNRIDA